MPCLLKPILSNKLEQVNNFLRVKATMVLVSIMEACLKAFSKSILYQKESRVMFTDCKNELMSCFEIWTKCLKTKIEVFWAYFFPYLLQNLSFMQPSC